MAYSDMSYVEWKAKREMLGQCDFGQVVILGDSRIGAAVDPTRLSVKATNFALAGAGTVEMYYVLKKALQCQDFPKHVVLSWTYLHLRTADFDFWSRAARSGMLRYSDFRDIERTSRDIGDFDLYKSRPKDGLSSFVRDYLYSIYFPPFYFNDFIASWGFTRYPINAVRFSRILATRGHLTYGDKAVDHSVTDDAKFETFVPSPLMDHYLNSILDMLAQRNVRVDLVVTPINETTDKKMSPEVRRALSDYASGKARAYPNVRLAGPVLAPWPDDYFGDNLGHLNDRGVDRYTSDFERLISVNSAM